jgi:hypothetical protein
MSFIPHRIYQDMEKLSPSISNFGGNNHPSNILFLAFVKLMKTLFRDPSKISFELKVNAMVLTS